MTADEIRGLFVAAVEGDVDALHALAAAPESAVLVAVSDMRLRVTPAVLRGVLGRLASGATTPERTQEWAHFARWGYLPAGQRLLPVDFDERYEDEIVEIMGRLDEIGDLIDGDPPTREEIAAMLKTLGPQ